MDTIVNKSDHFWLRVALYAVSLSLLIWSYALVDPNFVLLPWRWTVQLQQWFWNWGAQRQLLAFLYVSITLSWLGIWALFWRFSKKATTSWRHWVGLLAPIVFIFLLGYNALSHDIFNYLFNAKMVLFFHVNPHEKVALDFAYDPWVRFMHNIHTPAPYGYGWTGISLVPYVLGLGKFLPSYLFMKLWMALGLTFYFSIVWWILQKENLPGKNRSWVLFALNPLILIETVLNGHNDVWMMFPALLALGFAKHRTKSWQTLLLVVLLWIFSISMKWATIIVFPILVGLWLEPLLVNLIQHPKWKAMIRWFGTTWSDWSGILLLLPLFTSRSQWFHPWYLIWSLSFLPFMHWKWLKAVLLGLSVTSMWRYVPWMLNNLEYTPLVQQQMRWVTWSGALIGLFFWILVEARRRRSFFRGRLRQGRK